MERVKKIILGIILVSYFVIILDDSIIFTATVKMASTLDLSSVQIAWVQNSYALFFGGLLLLGGRVGDMWGRKKIFELGLIIFGVSSLLIGFSFDGTSLIIFRALQGAGAAIVAPTTLALIMDNFTGYERTKAISWYGSIVGIGGAISIVLGGIFAASNWRIGFFINFPICLIIWFLSRKYLQNSVTQAGMFDWCGAIVSMIAFFLLIYTIVGSDNFWLTFSLAIIFFIVLYLIERKHQNPLLPLSLFKNKVRLGAYLGRMGFTASYMSFWFFTPMMLQNYLHLGSIVTGMAFLPLTVVTFILSMQVPKLTKKFNNGKVMLFGLTISLIGMFWLTFYQDGYWISLSIPMMVLGIGQGLALAPLMSAALYQTNQKDAGAASGMTNVTQQLGGAIGISLVTFATSHLSDPLLKFQSGMKVIFALLVFSFLSALILVLPTYLKKR
ncbi:MFS transporter [Lactobacillus sp. S2-2]|uniref:MFS transporter n=1 Tax=Lactobacillus sp. S2-2 TaxID=2692917 RepID=UPI001F28EABC|nr:MFS transporter [Lactobacillus sp. S2-2]